MKYMERGHGSGGDGHRVHGEVCCCMMPVMLVLCGAAWCCVMLRDAAWVCVGLRGSAWVCVGLRGSAWCCVGCCVVLRGAA